MMKADRAELGRTQHLHVRDQRHPDHLEHVENGYVSLYPLYSWLSGLRLWEVLYAPLVGFGVELRPKTAFVHVLSSKIANFA